MRKKRQGNFRASKSLTWLGGATCHFTDVFAAALAKNPDGFLDTSPFIDLSGFFSVCLKTGIFLPKVLGFGELFFEVHHLQHHWRFFVLPRGFILKKPQRICSHGNGCWSGSDPLSFGPLIRSTHYPPWVRRDQRDTTQWSVRKLYLQRAVCVSICANNTRVMSC